MSPHAVAYLVGGGFVATLIVGKFLLDRDDAEQVVAKFLRLDEQ